MASSHFGDRVEHPSYATLGISRFTGKGDFFMSPISHNGGISLRIETAYKTRHLNGDNVFTDKLLVEVHMSEEQFARAITNLNRGGGTPVTLSWLTGVGEIKAEPRAHHRKVDDDELVTGGEETLDKQKAVSTAVRALMSKSSVSKKDLQELLRTAETAEVALTSNLPFLITRFKEKMDAVETAAKAEIASAIDNGLRSVGLESIANRLSGGVNALLGKE